MTSRPTPPATDNFAPTASRPASLWPESTRPSELRSSAFGSTLFGALPPVTTDSAGPLLMFDVCHVGVVLRAVLFVHAVMAVGVLFAASGAASWLGLVAGGSAVALPAVLMWLLMACLFKHPLGKLPALAQWLSAAALGAASGLFGWVLGTFSGADVFDGVRWLAPALGGAGMAVVIFQWLRLRAKAKLPADTTAQLAELQSRIRPHFLFNTLNTALSLVRLDPPRAEGVLEDLAELFRVALVDNGESVTLAEEVALAQRYLAIEQIRFGSRLQVSWELDPDAGAARVPPLLLQPLVENAVRHGVEPADEGGVIRVRTRVKMGRAVISIANSVPDVPSQPGNGIALRNVRERLRLMHDVTAQFETRLDRNVFRVQIVVPL
ncbi:sensor histidine kinase [Piscinibacter sp.]|jgi:two-component system sensor histidine kinase AlgZ|uniref:sensor histidine kinase n=1 Tax=Piscinibacter sp. TaxID=1903157 RepID=UPI003559E2C3